MKYRKKPVVVDGRNIDNAELVTTAHGRIRAEAGDWILTDPTTGDTWPIKPDIFAATYEPVAEEPEAGREEIVINCPVCEKVEAPAQLLTAPPLADGTLLLCTGCQRQIEVSMEEWEE